MMDAAAPVGAAPRRPRGRPVRARQADMAAAAKVAAVLTETNLAHLADVCDVTPPTVRDWLAGTTTPPPAKAELLVRTIFARWLEPKAIEE